MMFIQTKHKTLEDEVASFRLIVATSKYNSTIEKKVLESERAVCKRSCMVALLGKNSQKCLLLTDD